MILSLPAASMQSCRASTGGTAGGLACLACSTSLLILDNLIWITSKVVTEISESDTLLVNSRWCYRPLLHLMQQVVVQLAQQALQHLVQQASSYWLTIYKFADLAYRL